MNNSRMFDAVARIDDRLIERCLNRKKYCPDNTDNSVPVLRNRAALRRAFPITVSLALIIAISFSIIVTAYFLKQPVDTGLPGGQGLNIGFDFTKDEPVTGVRIAVAADKSKVNVGEDLPVSIYSICNAEDEKVPSGVTAKIFMSYSRIDPDNMIETVKVIDDGMSAGYRWNGSAEQMKSEKITIPAAVFTKAEKTAAVRGLTGTDGVIVWALEVNKKYADGSESTERDSVALYYRIEDNEVFLKPGGETTELAETAVEKLQGAAVFEPSLGSERTLTEEYNMTAKWVAPELITLETKKDAAIALIGIYENLLNDFRSCDLDRFYANTKPGFEPEAEYRDEYMKIVRLRTTRMTIEALLALDCYHDLLNTDEIQRMTEDFNEYVAVNNASESRFYDDVPTETMFDMYRRGGYGMTLIQ